MVVNCGATARLEPINHSLQIVIIVYAQIMAWLARASFHLFQYDRLSEFSSGQILGTGPCRATWPSSSNSVRVLASLQKEVKDTLKN
ncbi:hypothetical protein AMTR_s00003p00136040 [Amborella trichopoda]|uniref:Uncharacterized protein n=1 Tax=Amborella trichopoda TaxID=13333 RepID=W1P6I4_AMBTC|nr:hypothetical protein AMTR_s00003p00136040 [Amborella trichopoda]